MKQLTAAQLDQAYDVACEEARDLAMENQALLDRIADLKQQLADARTAAGLWEQLASGTPVSASDLGITVSLQGGAIDAGHPTCHPTPTAARSRREA